jgi:hypothetical protein
LSCALSSSKKWRRYHTCDGAALCSTLAFPHN